MPARYETEQAGDVRYQSKSLPDDPVTGSDFLTRVSYALRGTDDDIPTWGDDEAVYWIETLNRVKDDLFNDVSKQWRFAYKETAPVEPGTVATAGTTTLTGTNTFFTDYSVGDKITVSGETERTISAIASDTSLTVSVAFSNTASGKTFSRKMIVDDGLQTYSLHRSFIAPASKAYVVDTDSNRHYFDIIQPQERDELTDNAFITGGSPQVFNVNLTIPSTSSIVGGQLFVPGYFMPDDVDAETDLVPVPDANWAVLQVASEIAFNDITYEDKAADLLAKANDRFNKMVQNNRRGSNLAPRTIPNNLKRITGTDVL